MIQEIGQECFEVRNITEGVSKFFLLIFPPSYTWFQVTADIVCTLKKDLISLEFIGKRSRRYI